MTRRSSLVFVEEKSEVLIKYDVLCITEDEKMNYQTFIKPLEESYKLKNDEYDVSIMHIGNTTDIYKGVVDIVDGYKHNPLGSGDFDLYIYFMDYDRLYIEFYPSKAKSEAHIHLQRLQDLNINGYKIYVFPSFPSIASYFFGFHNKKLIDVLSDSLCISKSCNRKYRNKFGHEGCIVCKSSSLGISISTRNIKDLFVHHEAKIRSNQSMTECNSFNKCMRRTVLGREISFADLENNVHHSAIFIGKRHFFSTLDVFIEYFFEL